VSLGVRPEAVAVAWEEGVPALVDHVEDLGPHRIIHCRAGDHIVVAADGTPRTFAVGERVRLRIDPDSVCLYDGAGRRITDEAHGTADRARASP
jgi:sn-glycerol 3-phosphate transport system ATP-binding protein